MKEIEVSLNPIRGNVMAISKALPVGAAYYTVNAKEADKDYDKKKSAMLANPNNPDFILNRSPRWIELRTNNVIEQKFITDIDGTKQVVFNPGTDSEAKATVIAGESGFFQTTDEAVKDALHGQARIFADGASICARINSINRAEQDRLKAVVKSLNSMIDAIESIINANTAKVTEIAEQMAKYKPAVNISTPAGPVSVVITE